MGLCGVLWGRVRFHYGHPDVFDRLFHITQGGMSKASKGINLSEDIYAGEPTTRCLTYNQVVPWPGFRAFRLLCVTTHCSGRYRFY